MSAGLAHSHGAVAQLTPRTRNMYRFGFALFLFSEGMMFLTLFSTRFLLAGLSRPSDVNLVLGGALTGLMLLSVLPALEALRAASRGDASALRDNLLLTLVLGVLLLPGVAWEWASLTVSPGSRFGSVFFTALGIHAVHVAAGVLVLAGLAISADLGRFSAASHFAVEAGVLFWLFLVGAWVAIYAVFYLL
jgi:heme/copper-type cytochrome/quinol oxidase subunit 3